MGLRITGIVAAGGTGSRLGIEGGKQLLELQGIPIAAWSVDAVAASPLINDLIVVCDPDRVELYAEKITSALVTEKPVMFVAGGDTRALSVQAGLAAAKFTLDELAIEEDEDDDIEPPVMRDKPADLVVIHDGARPLLQTEDAEAVIINYLAGHEEGIQGAVLGIPMVDTLKRVDDKKDVLGTVDRSQYWAAQTPQVFEREVLAAAYERAKDEGFEGTDDASYIENLGGKVCMVKGSPNNIKITTEADLEFACAILI
jgi:2-C-methyl-D-erythritol 4-phosphate cytidylyltransferase